MITIVNLCYIPSMKTAKAGRVAKPVAISMSQRDQDFADKRVEELRPKVASRSNYIQQLIELDRQRNLLGASVNSPETASPGTADTAFVKAADAAVKAVEKRGAAYNRRELPASQRGAKALPHRSRPKSR